MTGLLMTGFPGFLASALLPRLLARHPELRAVCLVQPHHLQDARQRVAALGVEAPGAAGRVELVAGDVTAGDLALDPVARAALEDVTEVWHLAAVYDLAVPVEVARRVNVDGTAHVLALCRSLPGLERLHHVSTCYVSGAYAGEFPEDGLDEGQPLRNHYEETKFEAEMLVRKAMVAGLPATIYRPGIVVGDSVTGATQKYDGPYFLANLVRKLPVVAVVPRVGDPDRVRMGLAPRDFVVDAIDALSAVPRSLGRTYALTDPEPPTVREVVDTFAAYFGKRVVWLPLPPGPTRILVDRVPGVEWLLGLPAESVDYFASPTTHSTTNATRDLAGTGVECPRFSAYARRLLDFMVEHPEIDSAAMV
jgi:thioester reductase-like protein